MDTNIDTNPEVKELKDKSNTSELELKIVGFFKEDIIINEANKFDLYLADNNKFIDYKLSKMKNSTDKVKYTIYFNLTKDENSTWKMDEVSEFDEEKILGIYEY